MTNLMKGGEVAKSINSKLIPMIKELNDKNLFPKLGIIRVGERGDDLAYEKSAIRKMEHIGIKHEVFTFDEAISQQEFIKNFNNINEMKDIHGVLTFMPLPKQHDGDFLKKNINPLKDIDGMSPINIAKVFSGDTTGYAPCTSQAVMDMLEHYDVDLTGKRVAVIGRSMVVGRPLAMQLLKSNATVTICHTRTKEIEGTCKKADIVIAAAGKAKMVTSDFVSQGSIVIDVGINVDDEGNLCGDVDFGDVAPKAGLITPVPGGVGTVTTSVLAKNVVSAAIKLSGITI